MFWCHWLRGAWTCLFLVHYYYYNYYYYNYYSVARWCHGGLRVCLDFHHILWFCLFAPHSSPSGPKPLAIQPHALVVMGKKIVYSGTLIDFVEFYVRCVCANINKHVPEVWEHKKEPSCCLWTIFTGFPLCSPIFKSSFIVSSVIFTARGL